VTASGFRNNKRKCPARPDIFTKTLTVATGLDDQANYFLSPSVIRAIPSLVKLMATTTPKANMMIGTKSSTGMENPLPYRL
jgi:hypothetical protein